MVRFLAASVIAWSSAFSVVEAARIDPDASDLVVQPGVDQTRDVNIVNDSDQAQTYALSFLQVHFGQTAEEMQFVALDAAHSSWFSLSSATLTVAPHSTAPVTVTIAVPSEAVAETITFALIAQSQGSDNGGAAGVSIRSGLASLLFVTVGNGQSAQLAITGFEAIPSRAAYLPIRFVALLTNSGTGNIQPAGQAVIRNIFGHTVNVLPLTEVPRRVPAQTSRVFTVNWGAVAEGTGLLGEIKHFHLGRYTVTLEVASADGQSTLKQTVSVVLFPWRTVALVAGFFVVLLLLFIRRVRRSSR